jgi:SAM-dependent methyltransferase
VRSALSQSSADWRGFWREQNTPRSRLEGDAASRFYASELALHFPAGPLCALELGCGTGEQFAHLRPAFSFYVGVDISQPMLARFAALDANPCLVRADVTSLPFRGRHFDLIFSNGVAQYLDSRELAAHLDEIRRLLGPAGVCVTANIPDSDLRWFYYAGGLRGDRDASWWRMVRGIGSSWRARLRRQAHGMGHWYGRRQVVRMAERAGFACQTASSASYEYRFHAILRPRP